MNHSKHSFLMIGLLAVGAVLFFSGFTGGGGLFLLWILGCGAMMFFMMRAMGGMGGMGGNDDAPQADRDAERPPVDSEYRN